MKALLQAGLTGRVPAPPEKRFLISYEVLVHTLACIHAILGRPALGLLILLSMTLAGCATTDQDRTLLCPHCGRYTTPNVSGERSAYALRRLRQLPEADARINQSVEDRKETLVFGLCAMALTFTPDELRNMIVLYQTERRDTPSKSYVHMGDEEKIYLLTRILFDVPYQTNVAWTGATCFNTESCGPLLIETNGETRLTGPVLIYPGAVSFPGIDPLKEFDTLRKQFGVRKVKCWPPER